MTTSDRPGAKNPNAKLTENAVRAIRRSKRLQKSLAIDYGVSRSTISLIKQRKTWKHLPEEAGKP